MTTPVPSASPRTSNPRTQAILKQHRLIATALCKELAKWQGAEGKLRLMEKNLQAMDAPGAIGLLSKSGLDSKLDPVQRHLGYEKWYEAGELQQGFADLSAWNLIGVVDATDPDEVLAWGRQMLHTLRPDCIPNDGDTLVFVDVVDKEIRYPGIAS